MLPRGCAVPGVTWEQSPEFPQSLTVLAFMFSSDARFLFVRFTNTTQVFGSRDLKMFGIPLPQHQKLSTPSVWGRG